MDHIVHGLAKSRTRLSDFHCWDFPDSSVGIESACNAGEPGLIPGSGRSAGEGKGYPLQYSGLENPHRQRSLAGQSPLGRQSWTRQSD